MHAEEVAYKLLHGEAPAASTMWEPAPRSESTARRELGDLRFRALMREDDWASLPPAIRRRFSKRLAGGESVVYGGEVLETWMSRAGWWLWRACASCTK